MDFHSVTPALLRFQRPVSSVMLWSPSGFPFGVRRGMIGCGTMPLDTFTYYLLKVGFIPPLRAHSVSARSGSCRNRSHRSPAHFCFWRSWGPWGGCSWSGSRFWSESHCSGTPGRCRVQYPHGFPMKRFVKCFSQFIDAKQDFFKRKAPCGQHGAS